MAEDKFKETRQYDEERYKSTIIKELKTKKGQSTLSDVVVSTGLPREWVDHTLKNMMVEYTGHFSVTEKGEILYDFDPSFSKKSTGMEKFKQAMNTLAKFAWKTFVVLFKIWIMVTLIAYFIIFVVLLLALFFAQFAVGGKGKRRKGGFIPIGSLVRLLLIWDFWSRDKYYYEKRDGFSKPLRKKKKGGRKLHEKIFAFVFGEDKPKEDPLEKERETLTFIRQNKGRMVTSDLVALHSYTYQEAEDEAARLIANYEGDVEATDDGNVVYTFDKLMISASESNQIPQYSYCWEKMEPKEKFNKNSKTANWIIGLVNGFNLFMGIWALNGFLNILALRLGDPIFMSEGAKIILGTIPILFSSIFFTVPGVRSFVLKKKNQAIAYRNKIRNLIRRVFNNTEEKIYEMEIRKTLNYIGKTDKNETEKIAKRFAAEFKGDVDGDMTGIYYTFPRISEEQKEIDKIRQNVDLRDYKLGRIEYSTDDEKSEE